MLLGRRLQAERAADGLSLTKISVMGHLARRGEMTPTELAAADRLQPQSLTRVLAELERDGRVIRVRGTVDRRQRVLRLTAAGQADLKADMRQRDQWLARTMAEELSPTERDLVVLAAGLIERLGSVDGRPGFASSSA